MNGVQSIDRAFDVLECVFREQPVSLPAIARETGLSKSTAYRMVSALLRRGYVSRNAETGKYAPGLRLFAMNSLIAESFGITEIARPFLKELSDRCRETVHLLVAEDGEAVYIDKIEYPNAIKLDSYAGKRVPLYCTAAGKVLLAHMDERERSKISGGGRLRGFTRKTITDPELLEKELEKIKKFDYAVDDMEYEDNVRCAATPLRDSSGRVVAAVSVSGPAIRVKRKDLPSLVRAARECAVKISSRLGHGQDG